MVELVEAPARNPNDHGLFTVVNFRDSGDGRWQRGIQWEHQDCSPLMPPIYDECTDDPVGLPKTLQAGPGVASADPFTVVGEFVCSPVGYTPQTAQDWAETRLVAREEAAAESYLWDRLVEDADSVSGGESIGQAVAAVEAYLADNYGSAGVIHMSRYVAQVAVDKGAIERRSGRLETRLGTPVVAGTGYAGDTVIGSPRVFGYRSEVFTSSNNAGDLVDRSTNDLYAVAERRYVLGFDPCGVGIVQLAGDWDSGGSAGGSGADLEFNWDGTRLGVRQEGDDEYEYVDLEGPQGDKGDPGADGQGVPTGGTEGQILVKSSGDDYDTEWADQG